MQTSKRRTHVRHIPDLDHLPDNALITRAQLATLSNFAVITLKVWTRRGRGPRVTTIEGRPRYRVADVRAWLQNSGPAQ